jgi:hypothetical protein
LFHFYLEIKQSGGRQAQRPRAKRRGKNVECAGLLLVVN